MYMSGIHMYMWGYVCAMYAYVCAMYAYVCAMYAYVKDMEVRVRAKFAYLLNAYTVRAILDIHTTTDIAFT